MSADLTSEMRQTKKCLQHIVYSIFKAFVTYVVILAFLQISNIIGLKIYIFYLK